MKYNNGDKKWESVQALYRKTNSYNQIILKEPGITADLIKISKDTGVVMVGLDRRLKEKDSFLRKVNTDSDHSLDSQIIKDTINLTNDVIRYTYQSSPFTLLESYKSVYKQMSNKGYKTVKVKNTWLDKRSVYKGVNCVFESPEGQRFEVQFHTPESFNLKNGEMHKLYEESRKDTTSPARRAELNIKMFELSSQLEIPAYIDQVK
ncbi:hypothetical protein [Lacrimispora sp.]|uniref:hypothetical protein n=1 Tax=Lacrimispora sp. TaxID=2719234 RepID=UPI00345F6CFB